LQHNARIEWRDLPEDDEATLAGLSCRLSPATLGVEAHMRSRDRGWPSLDQTSDCMLGNHRDCCHFFGSFDAPEGEATVCSCACHSSCAVAKKKSGIEAELLAACTCPGGERLRRNLELLPEPVRARIEQLREASRQELAGGEAARKEATKRRLVRAYETAAAQVAGQPLENAFVPNPREAMKFFVEMLAQVGSEEEAARLLGLTADEVTAVRDEMHELRFRRIEEHLPERVIKRLRKRSHKQPWPPPRSTSAGLSPHLVTTHGTARLISLPVTIADRD
jgi:hypothetical protein